jgi:hypothetical protein
LPLRKDSAKAGGDLARLLRSSPEQNPHIN